MVGVAGIRGIVGKDLHLLWRDRNMLIGTLIVPIVILGMQLAFNPAVLRRARTKLPLVARVPEWLSAMTAVIPGQLTALRLAQLRGLDIDSPAGLKKVTLTR